jgi:transposase-like protein
MPKTRRKLDVVCPNKTCRCYGKLELLNVVRNGKKANGVQNYKCTECDTQFVRTRGTIFFHKKLHKKEVANMCRHLVETNSFRGVAREMQHNKNTICAYVTLLGEHCEEVNDFLINDVKLGEHEIDELWTFVKKNKRSVKTPDFETRNRATRTVT